MYDLTFLSTWPISFHGGSLRERPLGGSESALVELARRFARRGLRVCVLCPVPDGRPGRWDDVDYRSVEEGERQLAAGELITETLIICRDTTRAPLARHARRTHMWIQDMPMPGLRKQHRAAEPFLDRIFAVSAFQRDRFVEMFDLPRDMFVVTRNGVDRDAYRPWRERVPGRLVYCSTPFRGLRVLLEAMPHIRAAAPHAELHVYSGMAMYDQVDDPFLSLYQRAHELDGVVRHDPVPQSELVGALQQADLFTYPATFNETSCIAAMMAISAGAVPVGSARAGLPGTIGDCGVIVPGDAKTESNFPERFATAVVRLLGDAEERERLRARCAVRELDWEAVVEQWWPHVVGDELRVEAAS